MKLPAPGTRLALALCGALLGTGAVAQPSLPSLRPPDPLTRPSSTEHTHLPEAPLRTPVMSTGPLVEIGERGVDSLPAHPGEWIPLRRSGGEDGAVLALSLPLSAVVSWTMEGPAPSPTPRVRFLSPSGEVLASGVRAVRLPAGRTLVDVRPLDEVLPPHPRPAGGQPPSPATTAAAPGLRIRFDRPPDPDLQEPDDTPPRAVPLEPDTWVERALFPAGDADLFRLRIPEAGLLRVDLERVPAGLVPRLDLLDPAGRLLATGFRSVQVDPGEVLLRLRADHGGPAAPAPVPADRLRLRVHLDLPRDAQEPNDTVRTATNLPLDHPVELNFFPADDRDLFRFQLEETTLVEMRLERLPLGVWPVVRILRPDGVPETGPVEAVRLEPGEYLAEVRSGLRREPVVESLLRFTLARGRERGPDEPDDDPSRARPVRLGEVFDLELHPTRDVDWRVLERDEPTDLRVEILADGGVEPEVVLHGARGVPGGLRVPAGRTQIEIFERSGATGGPIRLRLVPLESTGARAPPEDEGGRRSTRPRGDRRLRIRFRGRTP